MVKWPGEKTPEKLRYGNGCFEVKPFFDLQALNRYPDHVLVPGDTATVLATALTLEEVHRVLGIGYREP